MNCSTTSQKGGEEITNSVRDAEEIPIDISQAIIVTQSGLMLL